MPHEWVNYKSLRAELSFVDILHHYGVELKERGEQWQGFCPLPTHEGQRKSPSLSANVAKGIWQCFGCGAKGNVIEFAARMEGLNPDDPGDFRKAALFLQKMFVGKDGEERAIPRGAIGKDTPRYLFPGSRERNGTRHVFRKSAFLYNGFRIENATRLVVVESFTGVWWLTQAGIPNVVALMGASCSEMQAALLRNLVPEDGSIWLFPDGDKAGERLAEEALVMLAPHCFMRLIKLAEGRQATDLSPEELRGRLHPVRRRANAIFVFVFQTGGDVPALFTVIVTKWRSASTLISRTSSL